MAPKLLTRDRDGHTPSGLSVWIDRPTCHEADDSRAVLDVSFPRGSHVRRILAREKAPIVNAGALSEHGRFLILILRPSHGRRIVRRSAFAPMGRDPIGYPMCVSVSESERERIRCNYRGKWGQK